ncbi:MAG: hypothetical protein IT440_04500 [Phycisphaeraceae bacterium]|nr:hypothetical protein [Phycisphaeraceae bacterium]
MREIQQGSAAGGVDASVARWHRHHKQNQTLIARVALEQVWAKAVEQLRQSS